MEFFLEVIEPQNESVVHQQSVEVVGRSTPDAVVSVNDTTAELDAQGNFTVEVSLKEGPNVIEVVASDFEGNQESVVIALVYVP